MMPGQDLPISVDPDLTPVGSTDGVGNMLALGKHVPIRAVGELIERADEDPGKLTYASAGRRWRS